MERLFFHFSFVTLPFHYYHRPMLEHYLQTPCDKRCKHGGGEQKDERECGVGERRKWRMILVVVVVMDNFRKR